MKLLNALSALFLFLPLASSASEVVKVYDGDTIIVRSKGSDVRVRFACVDAPEMAQQPYGQLSRDHLAKLLPVGTEVEVYVKTKDQYGRVVGEVVKDGESINLQMVQDGMAYVWSKFASQCGAGKMFAAEREARGAKRGVWGASLQKPWEYRYDNR
jgi:endonuclease YncB( thermonuclease family)